jgi:hypothetical protein
LYARLDLPLAWVGAARVRGAIADGLRALREAYGKPCAATDIDAAVAAAVRDDLVDFGRLDEAMQEAVLRRVVAGEDPGLRPAQLALAPPPRALERNRDAVRRLYNEAQYARRLLGLYGTMMDDRAGGDGAPDAARLLDRFLAPERFHLLRTG